MPAAIVAPLAMAAFPRVPVIGIVIGIPFPRAGITRATAPAPVASTRSGR